MDVSDDQRLLRNDKDAEELDILELYREHENSNLDITKTLGPLLSAKQTDVYSVNSILKGSLTLRECNEAYGNFGGIKYANSILAEFDRCTTKGCISPLRSFNNIIGHFDEHAINEKHTKFVTVCLRPEILSSIKELGESIKIELGSSIRKGYLWNLQNCNLCTSSTDNGWIYANEELNSRLSSMMDIVAVSFPPPLSAHTHHAWLESQEIRDSIASQRIFKQPEETTAVPGLIGTLQNNQIIDMAQEDTDENINAELRYKNLDIPGFLCKGHTAHSTEAGRVRRVCDKVSVRILNSTMLLQLEKVCSTVDKYNKDKKEWLLWCMGKAVYCTTKCILKVRDLFTSLSSTTIHVPTLYINSEMHTAIISVSSGVLLRRELNNLIVSSVSEYSSPWPDNKRIPEFPSEDTEEGFYFYYSSYFKLIPFIAHDRPPRTLIASVQSIQATSTPYGAGTSSIAPAAISKPLIYTPFIESLLNDKNGGLADNVPGMNLMICFANFNDTDEDAIIMNAGSAARGLFSYLGYSVHVINPNEDIPEVGKRAHISRNRWWKTYSRRHPYPIETPCILSTNKNTLPIVAGGDGTGTIISKDITQSGQISVKSIRYSTPVTGDKLATGHGQKGTIKLVKEQDMPWGVDENGYPLKFDIVMSLSSMTNRLTTGQYYEAIAGVKAAKEGRKIVVTPSEYFDEHTETVLYDGQTGELLERTSKSGDVPILASWGICRVWQMTQLTWDKQHYTHGTAGKYAINTTIGRTAGGGIKYGEMDTHAADASGLYKTTEEIKSKIDLIDTQFCTRCEEFIDTCGCGNKRSLIPVSIPWSALVFGYSNVITSGYVNKYKVGF